MTVTLLLLLLVGVVVFVVRRSRPSGQDSALSSSGDGDSGFAGTGDHRDEHHAHGSEPDHGSHDGGHDGDGGDGGGSDGGGSDGGGSGD